MQLVIQLFQRCIHCYCNRAHSFDCWSFSLFFFFPFTFPSVTSSCRVQSGSVTGTRSLVLQALGLMLEQILRELLSSRLFSLAQFFLRMDARTSPKAQKTNPLVPMTAPDWTLPPLSWETYIRLHSLKVVFNLQLTYNYLKLQWH